MKKKSITNCSFEKWFTNPLQISTRRYKELDTLVSGQKNNNTTLRPVKIGEYECSKITVG